MGCALAAWPISWRSMSESCAGLLITPASCSRCSIAAENSAPSPAADATTILIAQLSDGAVSMPALGFAMGDVVLGELINEIPRAREAMQKAIANDSKIDIYVVIAKEQRRADALAQIQQLRDRGYRVDYPLTANQGRQTVSNRRRIGRARRASFRRRMAAGESKESGNRRARACAARRSACALASAIQLVILSGAQRSRRIPPLC